MTHRLWGFLFPGHSEKLCLPTLVSGVALLPDGVSIVIQQHPECAHVMTHYTVVEGEAEAAFPGAVAEKQLQFGHILLLP